MQSVWSGIWTRVAVSISYDNNHCTTEKFMKWLSSQERDFVARVKIQEGAVFYSSHNTFGKGMNPTIHPSVMDK